MSVATETDELLRTAENGVRDAIRALTTILNDSPEGSEELRAAFRQNLVDALHQLMKAREALR